MFWFFYFFVHILFSTISEVDANKRDANTKFANLLKDLVSINERRFEAMKELARLQEYSVTKYQLRSGRDYFDDEKNSRRVLVIFISERVLSESDDSQQSLESFEDYRSNDDPKSNLDKKDDEDGEERIQENYIDALSHNTLNKGVLRNVWRGCNKKAAKVCKKACYSAYKNVCSSYSCKSGMKREFKRECKSSCKSRFRADDRDD